jgi:hypothetical protein
MQYYKVIEQSEYDNNGNSVDQTRYEVIGDKKKLYIYGYDYCSGNTRKLDVSYSYDMNNYKPLLTYFSSKNNISTENQNFSSKYFVKYIYHRDKSSNQEIYSLIQKMFSLQPEYKEIIQEEQYNGGGCIIS